MTTTDKPSKSKNKPSWPPIVERHYPSGQVAFMVAVMTDGKRIRKTYETRKAAEEYAEQLRIAKKNEGTAAFSLAPDERAEAAKCIKELKPYGVTLTEAVKHYTSHVLAYRHAPTVAVIVEKMIAEAESAGRREKTVDDLRSRLGYFAETFGQRQVSTITMEEIGRAHV